MDTVTGLRLFIRVVEAGSFSKASSDLGITQPTATKHVAALERRLGARLLHRSTRGVTPTEVGAAYYDKCKSITRELDDADSLAALMQSRVQGRLRLATSVAFGRRVLTPLVLRFMQQHPGLQIDLSFEDRYVNLVEQGIDLAIRMGRLSDSGLGARYLGTNPWVLVASPNYLAEHGPLSHPGELSSHPALIYSSVQGDDRWHFTLSLAPEPVQRSAALAYDHVARVARQQAQPGGPAPDATGSHAIGITPTGASGSLASLAVPVRGPLRSNNLSALLAAARAGMGLAILPRYVAQASITSGALLPVLERWALPEQEIHAVYPSPRLVPTKVSGFVDWLQGQFGPAWWMET